MAKWQTPEFYVGDSPRFYNEDHDLRSHRQTLQKDKPTLKEYEDRIEELEEALTEAEDDYQRTRLLVDTLQLVTVELMESLREARACGRQLELKI